MVIAVVRWRRSRRGAGYSSSDMHYSLQSLRGDVLGGLMSALVVLTPSVAFGVVAGLDATSGIYAAAVVGLFVGVFERSRPQMGDVSSVTAIPMAVVVATYADSLAKALTIVMLAGLMQLALGLLRLARFVAYTPYSVIAGFTSGVGVLIIVSMVRSFLGQSVWLARPATAVREWPDAFATFDPAALAIGAVTLTVALGWPKRLRAKVPPMLAGLAAGTLLSVVWLSDVATLADLPTGLPELAAPVLSPSFLAEAVTPALTIALLSTVRALLSIFATDAQTRTQLDPDRSLVTLGAGNIAAGMVGGLAGHQSFIPTMIAVRSGATTRVAVVVRSLVLVGIVLGLARYLAYLPHAALAGVLVIFGWQLIDWRFFARLHRVQREHLLIMLTTLGIMLFVDLVTAVAVGLIVAGMIGARQFERLQLDSVVSVPLLDQVFLAEQSVATAEIAPYSARTGIVKLRGSFTVASSSKLIRTIGDDIVGHHVVILDFSETDYIDDSAALVIERLIDTAAAEGVRCIVVALDGAPAATLESLNVLRRIPAEHRVASLDEAREATRRLLD